MTTAQPDAVRTSRPARISHIDNLRVFLTLLVITHHFAAHYSNLDAWPKWQRSVSSPAAELLDLLLLVNQTFFMGFSSCCPDISYPARPTGEGRASSRSSA